jgi:mRNA interferase MazF
MRLGKMHKFGEIVLAEVQFTDTFETKVRPALVLFEEEGNVVVAGITSNMEMEGVKLTRKEGAIKESIIKLNYIFTISEKMIKKNLFAISEEKKKIIKNYLFRKFE